MYIYIYTYSNIYIYTYVNIHMYICIYVYLIIYVRMYAAHSHTSWLAPCGCCCWRVAASMERKLFIVFYSSQSQYIMDTLVGIIPTNLNVRAH